MEPSKKDFHTIEYRDLARDLTPDPTNRLLAKDISRRTSLPIKITEGARLSDYASVLFWANASAGNFTTTIDLDLPTVPIALVWFMGSIDKAGTSHPGGGLVFGSSNDSGSVSEGIEVFSGAKCNYSISKDSLVIKITSTNVGWSTSIDAYFRYAVYYDETNVAEFGL